MKTIVEYLQENKNGGVIVETYTTGNGGKLTVTSRYAAVQVNQKFYEPMHTTNDWPVNIQLPSTLKWKK